MLKSDQTSLCVGPYENFRARKVTRKLRWRVSVWARVQLLIQIQSDWIIVFRRGIWQYGKPIFTQFVEY